MYFHVAHILRVRTFISRFSTKGNSNRWIFHDMTFLEHGKLILVNVSVTYMRPMRTNELGKDIVIPDTETSVIAAIGPLNLRGEANAHHSFDKTTEDIRIDFTSRNVHDCTNSLYNLPDTSDIKPWPPAVITNETTFTARIGPAGGKRGYTSITGIYSRLVYSKFISKNLETHF